MDVLTLEQRSRNMRAIKATDTAPELTVRRLLHSMGFRFRLHRKDLPGSPDIVLPRFRVVCFVHGCFWHRHHCRYGTVIPATRMDFWLAKFAANLDRDRRVMRSLHRDGWRVIVVWECQTRNAEQLRKRLTSALAVANPQADPVSRLSVRM